MSYSLKAGGISSGVIRDSDGANIPADPKNKDWQEYLEWQSKSGNQPKAYVRPQNEIDNEALDAARKERKKVLIDSLKKSKIQEILDLLEVLNL